MNNIFITYWHKDYLNNIHTIQIYMNRIMISIKIQHQMNYYNIYPMKKFQMIVITGTVLVIILAMKQMTRPYLHTFQNVHCLLKTNLITGYLVALINRLLSSNKSNFSTTTASKNNNWTKQHDEIDINGTKHRHINILYC